MNSSLMCQTVSSRGQQGCPKLYQEHTNCSALEFTLTKLTSAAVGSD